MVVPAGTARRLDDVLAGPVQRRERRPRPPLKGGDLFANSRFYNVGAADGNVYGMYIPSTNDRETVRYGTRGSSTT